jgi:hypothetical protein
MTILQIDDSSLEQAMLAVTFTDREEKWGPSMRAFAEMMKEQLDRKSPEGYVASNVEPLSPAANVITPDPQTQAAALHEQRGSTASA